MHPTPESEDNNHKRNFIIGCLTPFGVAMCILIIIKISRCCLNSREDRKQYGIQSDPTNPSNLLV